MNHINDWWRINDKDNLDVFARLSPAGNVKLLVLTFFRIRAPCPPHHEFRVVWLNVVLADVLNIGGIPAKLDHTDYFTTKFNRVNLGINRRW